MTIVDALVEAAADLDGAEAAETDGRIEWRRSGVAFAAVAGPVAEFRLAPVVAQAALGTPDTRPSGRGRDWVAFEPATVDRVALDRATAWLASAYRHALG